MEKAGCAPFHMNFFAVLNSTRERLALVDQATTHTDDQIENVKRLLKIASGVEYLTNLGALYELEGRKKWLAAVRNSLGRTR